MKTMKKYLSLFFVMAIIFTNCYVPINAIGNNMTITASTDVAAPQKDEIFTITVKVGSTSQDIGTMQIQLEYDPTKIEYQDSANGELGNLFTILKSITNEDTYVDAIYAVNDEAIPNATERELFTVTFKVLTDVSEDVTPVLKVVDAIYDGNYEEIPYTLIGTTVTANPAHEHSFSTEWSKDDTYHWHAADCGHDTEVADKAEHVYDKEVVDEQYKITDADCKTGAKYFKSCVCGAKPATETEENVFYSQTLDHTYVPVDAQIEVHTPTELKGAVAAHYKCSVEECSKLFTLNGETYIETTLEALTSEAPVHNYVNENGYKESDGHADTCSCGAKDTVVPHTPGAAATETSDQICTVCEYVITPKLNHVHTNNLTHVPAKTKSCTDNGNIEYWTCSCDKWFSDENATTEITDKNIVVIPAGHEYTPVTAKEAVHTQIKLEPAVEAHYKCSVEECSKLFTLNGETYIETTLDALTGETPVHNADKWTFNDEQHWKICSVCDYVAENVVKSNHTFDNIMDTTCNDECGYTRGAHIHTYSDEWSHNGENHWHEATCGCENEVSGLEPHHGGTATCTTQAVCVDCGQSYGTFADHNYGTKIDAKPEVHETDKLEAGVAAHYFCDECDTYFTEEKEATDLETLTGETPTHNAEKWDYNADQHWKICSVCDYVAENVVKSNHTFDNIMDTTCECGYTRDAHEHTPAEGWEYDEEDHWKVCSVEGCGTEIENTRDEHEDEYKNGLCDKCQTVVAYIVTFDENGGSEVEDQYVPVGEMVFEPTAPTKEGHNFIAWLLDGEVFTFFRTVLTGNITLVAQWEEIQPEVPATTSVTVTKEWNVPETFDLENLPESVMVALYAGEGIYGEPVTLNAENNWTCTWTELPVATENGATIVYTVDEIEVPEVYAKTITDAEVPAGIGFTITNTLIEEEPEVPATTFVTVTKEWVVPETFDLANLPESVEVYLLANGQEVTDSSTVLDAGNQWTYTWEELPVATEDGAEIEYSVAEVVVEGYETSIEANATVANGFVITNTLIEEEPEVPETTSVTVVKEWDAPEGTVLPEAIEVYLIANGQQVEDSTVRLTAEEDWTYTYENLPVATENGADIVYTVDEVDVDGFEKVIGDAIETDTGIEIAITNTLIEEEPEVPETTTVTVVKEWDAPEGTVLPEAIEVYLLANGQQVEDSTVGLTAEEDWTYTFENLPVATEDGADIVYTVDEVDVDGYTKDIGEAIETDTGIEIAITNTLIEEEPEVPETTTVTVVKEWAAPEGTVLPEAIEVYLLANGQEVTDSSTVLDAGNQWTYTWEELPVATEDGADIVYTVDEVDVDGYEKVIGDAIETDTGIEIAITNTLIEKEPEVPVEPSVSLDPTAITIVVGETAELTAIVTPEDLADYALSWSSSDETVATVNLGEVSALKVGTTTITVTLMPNMSPRNTDGYPTATCLVTVIEKEEELPETHKHTPEVIPGCAPTCTTVGYTDGSKCKDCGTILVEQQTIPKLPHERGDVVIENMKFATPYSFGGYDLAVYCVKCHTELDRDYIILPYVGHIFAPVTPSIPETPEVTPDVEPEAPHIHTYEDVKGFESTCTENGLTNGVICGECGETIVAQKIVPAKEHTYSPFVVENLIEATATENGSYELVSDCSVCGEELARIKVDIPATGGVENPDTADEETSVNAFVLSSVIVVVISLAAVAAKKFVKVK